MTLLRNVMDHMKGKLNYYQGLNFVVGYCMLMHGSPEDAAKQAITLLETLMTKYITLDLVQVKKTFFIYERLIDRFTPRLYKRLRREKISVDIFCTSWILTIFSLLSQYNPESADLAEIWDLFLASGWPGMFKVLIAILKIREELLLELSYEEMMGFFSSLAKSDAFTDQYFKPSLLRNEDKSGDNSEIDTPRNREEKPRESIKDLVQSIPITDELVSRYELEYVLLEKEIESTWTLLKETKY